MKIPDSIRIGSMDYKVELVNAPLVLDRKEVCGMIEYMNHTIKVRTDCNDIQAQEQTFLHEIVHGIIYERNLDIHNSDEETIVDEIATSLHQIIRDNPIIFKQPRYYEVKNSVGEVVKTVDLEEE